MEADAVIGAGFGDEGKGVWVDRCVAQRLTQGARQVWVVRFNGGAQAGHTVQTPEGARHVFHHWGSGALSGASTYLGAEFVCHPMLARQEREALEALGAQTRMAVDPRARVSTPFDVLINQAIERARGQGRHGSCGVGFGETYERAARNPDWDVRVSDLVSGRWATVWNELEHGYVPYRLRALGLPAEVLAPWHHHAGIRDRFEADVAAFLKTVDVVPPEALRADAVVFEGAQGLRLDEELGEFPHVTRSKCGLPWLLEVADAMGVDALHVAYATRAYLTRHGAGPLPYEQPGPTAPGFGDATNQPNAYQGSLRFAHVDPMALGRFIRADLARVGAPACLASVGLVVSCLDQMGAYTTVQVGVQEASVPTEELPEYLRAHVGADWTASNHGPTRATYRGGPATRSPLRSMMPSRASSKAQFVPSRA